MEDREIVELFFSRSERAIAECDAKYGRYCRTIAKNILGSDEDAEEAVNDSYLSAWNSIPPKRPERLAAYLGMVCRSRAIDKARKNVREKRGGGYELALDEFEDVVSGTEAPPSDAIAIRDALNSFLSSLGKRERVIFMRRYFWCSSVLQIADDLDISEGAVKMTLLRTRKKLKEHLEKEGFEL